MLNLFLFLDRVHTLKLAIKTGSAHLVSEINWIRHICQDYNRWMIHWGRIYFFTNWCSLIKSLFPTTLGCAGLCRFYKYFPPLWSKHVLSINLQLGLVGFINTHLFQVLSINLQLINFFQPIFLDQSSFQPICLLLIRPAVCTSAKSLQ